MKLCKKGILTNMQKISTLIGTISPNTTPVDYGTTENGTGEKFLLLRASFKTVTMDVVVSEYIYHGETGRVKVTGGLCIRRVEKEDGTYTKHFFIYANNIEKADESEEETNRIHISGKLTSKRQYIVTKAGLELLFGYILVPDVMGDTSLMKVNMRRFLARKYKNAENGTVITGEGYIKTYKNSIEVLIDEITQE